MIGQGNYYLIYQSIDLLDMLVNEQHKTTQNPTF
ncbi:RNA-directed RNA polymerase L [Bacillus phage BSTP4]|uniref:RNA-directed RNA polymerase L n=1 Tax=Bacillus phage BSTP4 TaxID=2801529 RepID=A0A7T8IVF4_9CAUD|nr:RNA-directed RNA polymerase L [Bacillus phage BSTP4]